VATLLNWSLLWVVLAVASCWCSLRLDERSRCAVRPFARTRDGGLRFRVRRITAAVVPVLATWLIADYGWRMGFIGVATPGSWSPFQ
jgi:hypothetical protein